MRRIVLFVLAFCATLSVALPTAASAEGGVDDFSFRSMHADYTLTRADDGTSRMRVVETLVAEFPETDQNRGIRRMIPDFYGSLPMKPDVISVTDENGTEREWEADDDTEHFVTITSAGDGYVHGDQTYVITYDLRYVTRLFDDTGRDEFYWDVNGTAWPQSFGEVSMTLSLDSALASALTGDLACYQGRTGESERCEIAHSGTSVTARSRELAPYENMTVAVGFEAGTFAAPDTSYFGSTASWVQVGAGAVSLAALGDAFFARRRWMRDDEGHPTVVAQYGPPPGYDALAASVLLGRGDGATAELLEQAVRGSIRLVEREQRFGGPKLVAELVDPRRAGDADGAEMLAALFGENAAPGAEYAFDGTDSDFATKVSEITMRVRREIADAGTRRKVPVMARLIPIVVSLLAFAAACVAAVFFIEGTVGFGVGIGATVLFFAALIVVIWAVSKSPFTRAGAQTRDHLRGLEMFMRWAEADRIAMLQSRSGAERIALDDGSMLRLYEPLLPYAVIFGLEKQWSGLVTTYYERTGAVPLWYVGTHGFSSASLAGAMTSAGAAMSSSTASSSSGGSGGGGASGGGGGGGGGGGV